MNRALMGFLATCLAFASLPPGMAQNPKKPLQDVYNAKTEAEKGKPAPAAPKKGKSASGKVVEAAAQAQKKAAK